MNESFPDISSGSSWVLQTKMKAVVLCCLCVQKCNERADGRDFRIHSELGGKKSN